QSDQPRDLNDAVSAICNFLVFFFSSRRRHTRFKCDWSSDVCSSDLTEMVSNINRHGPLAALSADDLLRETLPRLIGITLAALMRSEERRVGKECGSLG